jgi:hypothetical protein
VHAGPQLRTVPQLLVTVPQLSGAGHEVKLGVHPQTLGLPPPPHVCGAVQLPPQLTVPPQPSGRVPQFFPPAQRVAAVPAWQHTFGMSPCAGMPPQVSGAVHGAPPQLMTVPQLLVSVPQFSPAGHVVKFGVQPHWLGVPPPPHVFGAVQRPHRTTPPQPSPTKPQLSPAGQVMAPVQPHWLGVPPPPQVCGALHVPQLASVPPQPFEGVPQLSPSEPHVASVHPHLYRAPVPPHVLGRVQVPLLRVPPQPSDGLPQLSPSEAHVAGVQPQW